MRQVTLSRFSRLFAGCAAGALRGPNPSLRQAHFVVLTPFNLGPGIFPWCVHEATRFERLFTEIYQQTQPIPAFVEIHQALFYILRSDLAGSFGLQD